MKFHWRYSQFLFAILSFREPFVRHRVKKKLELVYMRLVYKEAKIKLESMIKDTTL